LSDLRYTDKRNWKEIERQRVFEALLPYVPERPIEFFVPDPSEPNKGTICKHFGDTQGAAEQKVVLTLKRRKVLILSSDENCQSQYQTDVTVAKVSSISEKQKSTKMYQLLVSDRHPLFAYLPKDVTGVESYVDLSSVTTIGKSMLLSKKVLIPAERMQLVNQRLEECIALGIVKEDEVAENVERSS
jgi:mRNA-degrading endonuclease toxin of MazEF toxin-antitoxin module